MRILFSSILSIIFLAACTSGRKVTAEKDQKLLSEIILSETQIPKYNPSETRFFDLLHTKLEVSFDYSKSHLHGRATLTLKPYFYPATSVKLDAKGFDISKVELLDSFSNKEVAFDYDGETITINLEKSLTRRDTFHVYIEYIAKPNERETDGSDAISSDKGLYFINPLGEDSKKPIQIWTQGETESNSAWFPTIDSPNERMTQEIYITADNKYVTLSNGTLMFSLDNGDGTHTDYWKQELPHAPYLTAMVVGEFAIIKDQWRDIDVNYYVEKKYESYAQEIFGKTPEMIEFYSKKLGFDYPWDKYHQVIVRDYVSGAMENTGAVIFGEFAQRTHKEMIDDNEESIIAHELFHHWFGDLVTCESWANLPLNESFATYGEYLWLEHKHGRDEADYHIQKGLTSYLAEANQKQENLIRFYYNERDDMFDSHSYAKGGRVLHMLRKHVGDEAFFESLNLYLETNKYTAVEIHQLRLAFETITGEDLNWFFDQWFFSSGHPNLFIQTKYDEINKKATLEISQDQNKNITPIYKLPVEVDIYVGDKVKRHHLVIEKVKQEFSFDCEKKPSLINFDAEKMLLCEKKEKKTDEEWAFQYQNSPLYLDRFEAIENLSKATNDSLFAQILFNAFTDKHWNIRIMAVKYANKIPSSYSQKLKEQLIYLAQKDATSRVRAASIHELSVLDKDNSLMDLYLNALNDSSYRVISEALASITEINWKEGLMISKQLENTESTHLLSSIAMIYSKYGSDAENQFYKMALSKLNGYNRYGVASQYANFLNNCKDETIISAIPTFESFAKDEGVWWIRLSGINGLAQIYSILSNRVVQNNTLLKQADPTSAEASELENKISKLETQKQQLIAILEKIRTNEKNPNLVNILDGKE